MAGETSREIEHTAAQWAARLDRAPLSAADEAALEAWLKGDTRRLGAYAKARAVALHSQRAAALNGGGLDRALGSEAPVMDRRALMAASVAAGLIGSTGLLAAYWRKAQSFQTAKGEVRSIVLDDGSTMILNTATRASVRFSQSAREVVLTFGEAYFKVAADARPFVVRTAGTRLLAEGGGFVVRRLNRAPMRIMAVDAEVHLSAETGSPRRIQPQRVVAMETHGVQERSIDQAAMDRALAWRDMQIALENQTLAAAVVEFARFSDVVIELANPSVAAMRISGLFKADDPAAFVRAAAVSLNLPAQIGTTSIRLG